MEDKVFWDKVLIPDSQHNCWLWQGNVLQSGYGRIKISGTTWRAHRLAWMLKYGTIPNGLLICHTCDVKRCVNPAHMFLGTHADNHADRNRKGRQAKGDRNGSRLHPERMPRGEAHGMSRLTTQQVVEIRQKYAHREKSQAALGDEYGVNQTHISRIIRQVNWKEND